MATADPENMIARVAMNYRRRRMDTRNAGVPASMGRRDLPGHPRRHRPGGRPAPGFSGQTPGCRRRLPAGNGGNVAQNPFPRVPMRVDKAGRHDHIRGIDGRRVRGAQVRPDGGDPGALDQHTRLMKVADLRIDAEDTADVSRGFPWVWRPRGRVPGDRVVNCACRHQASGASGWPADGGDGASGDTVGPRSARPAMRLMNSPSSASDANSTLRPDTTCSTRPPIAVLLAPDGTSSRRCTTKARSGSRRVSDPKGAEPGAAGRRGHGSERNVGSRA